MQHSKSLGSFCSGSTALVTGQRPRARSSLDTFVIPGRTRIPSSKPEPIDLQIAENLLNPVMDRPMRGSIDGTSPSEPKNAAEEHRLLGMLRDQISRNAEDNKQQPAAHPQRPSPASSSQGEEPVSMYTLESHSQTLHKVRPEISKRPPPKIGGREVIVVPPRRPRKSGGYPPLKRLQATPPRKVTPVMNQPRPQYDGAIGSSYESRTTSMTWSTISHRILTNSSESSQSLQASENLEEFNRLATQHGLPELGTCPGDEHTKTTEKSHHHNWLARKLFHRTSSTYTLKIKSNHKPLKRKKSFGVIPKLEDFSRKNVLKDKSLEEVCRLGGMGVLILPEEFSATKQLPLPTCLSATATYLLQHGTNNPGLFRVSGQSSTISTLYEYYACQFVQAGSPSKVQETVGSGLLPTYIEHSVPDVASLFKKILIALPGGLLGSLELFEAIRNIFFRLPSSPDLAEYDTKVLQAKFIALAISTVKSAKRVSLIQAVMGLVAYFGHEAESARRTIAANAANGEEETQLASELMGFQALGVVMGPLMMGTLIDQIDPILTPDNEEPPRQSFESAKKGDKKAEKKPKRSSFSNKADRDATLSAHVDRANLTANIFELLLIIWKDVVVQLREIQTEGSSTSLPNADRRLTGAGSRQQFPNMDEELLFMDIIKGSPLRAGVSGEFKMKRKATMGKSSRARSIRHASSESSRLLPALKPKEGSPAGIGKRVPIETAASDITVRVVQTSESSNTGSVASNSPASLKSLQDVQRTKSDIGMAQMAMGTILPRLQDSPITPLHKEMLRSPLQPHTPQTTPQTSNLIGSSGSTPQTALYVSAKPDNSLQRRRERGHSSFDETTPPTGDIQAVEQDPPVHDEQRDALKNTTQDFPTRTSSLSAGNVLKTQPSSRPSEPNSSTKRRVRSSATLSSRKTSRRSTQDESAQAVRGNSNSPGPSKQGNVKVLVQGIDDATGASKRAESTNNDVPIIYAKIYALPTPKKLRRDDPFFSFSDASSEKTLDKASRIPKPARDVGKVRKDNSGPPSPTKSPKSPKSSEEFPSSQKQLAAATSLQTSPSLAPRVPDTAVTQIKNQSDAKSESAESSGYPAAPKVDLIAMSNANRDDGALQVAYSQQPQVASDNETPTQPSRSPPLPPRRTVSSSASCRKKVSSGHLEVAPTRPLSAYSVESLRRMRLDDEPPIAQHIPTRVISIGARASEPERASEVEPDKLKRSGSVNSTMAAEIYRLKRLLEQKDRDVRETKRSLDALRDSREDVGTVTTTTTSNGTVGGGGGGGGGGGSASKGTLANELRIARKETAQWRKRAEWAEGRLDVLDRKSRAEAEARESDPADEPTVAASSSGDFGGDGGEGKGRPKYWLHE